ncbi:MAG TPA: DUF4178 domain-containing protein [Micromonosporaceae bacterium]
MNGTAAYVMAMLGCLVAVAGVVIAVIALRRTRRPAPGPAQPPPHGGDPFRDHDADALRGDPRRLQPGDIVEIRGRTYAVRGTLRFQEGGWNWAEHLLDDAVGGKVWLSVEEDPDLELVLWHEVPSTTVTPGLPAIDFDGRRYISGEAGQARYTAFGTTGLDPTGTVRYHDYRAPDGTWLSFESYGDSGRWEVGRGEQLYRTEVRIYPSSGVDAGPTGKAH